MLLLERYLNKILKIIQKHPPPWSPPETIWTFASPPKSSKLIIYQQAIWTFLPVRDPGFIWQYLFIHCWGGKSRLSNIRRQVASPLLEAADKKESG